MKYKIPLFYNPIDVDNLSSVLKKYEGINHQIIVEDFEKEIQKVNLDVN